MFLFAKYAVCAFSECNTVQQSVRAVSSSHHAPSLATALLLLLLLLHISSSSHFLTLDRSSPV